MAKQKILLVEDERDLILVLRRNFAKEGYELLSAGSAEKGLAMARAHRPDLVISDIKLPKMDGLDMVRLLRQESQIPVLFLTARKDEVDRVLGFRLGADDYLTKPFSVRELLARVKAILRRVQARRDGASDGLVRVGELEVDLDRHEVRVGGKFRALAPREFQLLTLLLNADGKVLSREELLKQIWGYDESMDISTRTVDQHIARLRGKLLYEKRRIATVKNFGYQLKMR